MKKAVFIDFYGTLVHEEGPIAAEFLKKICATGNEKNPKIVYSYWWKCFRAYLQVANEGNFYNQYVLAQRAFYDTVAFFASNADPHRLCDRMVEHWSHPIPYPESKQFLNELEIPYYIVTNGDSAFLDIALRELALNPAGVISSEKACVYKPNYRIFEAALKEAGLTANEVVHIGDSLDNDIKAAESVGIKGIWLNRVKTEANIVERNISDLLQVLEWMKTL